MSAIDSIAHGFATYSANVIPAQASWIQVEECRRAFYAGSYFLLMNLMAHIGDEATDVEVGVRYLEILQAECEAFINRVARESE